jgi:hypothetical protein
MDTFPDILTETDHTDSMFKVTADIIMVCEIAEGNGEHLDDLWVVKKDASRCFNGLNV